VLRKEVRGKRIFQNVGVAEDQGMFQTGADADHEGLRAAADVPEVDPPARQTGRNLCRQEAMGHFEEENRVFDRDIGESGSSSSDGDGDMQW
jgi:hypothetical protein